MVEIGERVKRRGKFKSIGFVREVNIDSGWVSVEWNAVDGEKCPRLLHFKEIETVK